MPFADVDNVRIFYTDEGKGPPMLFVHGFSCDVYDWNWQLAHFARNHRVIAADLRGHGRSSAPQDGYEPRRFAQDLAILIDQLDCGPVVAVGHSLGGIVVSALAVEHPSKIASVIGVDPAYLMPEQMSEMLAPMLQIRDPGQTVSFAQALLNRLYSPASPEHLRGWHLRRAASVPDHVLRQTATNPFVGPDPLGLASVSAAYLQRRHCPALVFYTDPARASLEASLFNHSRSRAVSWEGSGHWLHQERPTEFNTIVDGWLADI